MLYKVLVFWQFRGQFWHWNTVFAPNPLRLSIEGSKVCEISKLTLGLYFEILILHPHNSKYSLLTTGTFWYVESHMESQINHQTRDSIFFRHAKKVLWRTSNPFYVSAEKMRRDSSHLLWLVGSTFSAMAATMGDIFHYLNRLQYCYGFAILYQSWSGTKKQQLELWALFHKKS